MVHGADSRVVDCKSGCDRANLFVIPVGHLSSDKVIIECSMCQHSTPVLSLNEAIEDWNKSHAGEKDEKSIR